LRPLISLTILNDYNVPLELGLDAACAVEMIHTYSLIHDDLPCIDNDDMRRSLPTLHKAFNEGLALLTGDYLLTYAFEILSNLRELPAETRLDLIQCLAHQAGGLGMIGGQVIDISLKHQYSLDKQIIDTIHLGKTGALFKVAFLFGGFIAQMSKNDILTLEKISVSFGKAFQYIDDFEDFYSNKQESVNILKTLGVEKTLEEIDKLKEHILSNLNQLTRPMTALSELLSQYFNHFLDFQKN
jgi:geranylgeranyl pyrophosphate synthase